MVYAKGYLELQPKDTVVPMYPTSDAYGMTSEVEGKTVTFSATSKIEMKPMPNGYYLAMANIYDQRGDSYNSKVIGYDISGGKITNCEVDPYFIGSDY